MTLCDRFLKDLHQSLAATVSEKQKNGPPKSSSQVIFERLTAAQVPISCQTCDDDGVEGDAFAYIKSKPVEIILCSNRLKTEKLLHQALAHEATHAYDFLHKRCDFYTCDGLAYSEVRAARNAECASRWPPFLRKYCAQELAEKSTNNLYPNQGKACVARVFDRAYEDNEPTS